MESFAQFGDIAPTVEILNGEGLTGNTISSIESVPIDDELETNPRQWWDIVFTSPAQLTAGNTYTILMKVNNINALDGLMRTFTQADNPYPNGSFIDRQSNITSRDMPFETFIGQGDLVTLELDASGSLSLSTDQIIGSSDACGIANLQLSQTALDCEDVGVNTITLSVTDNNGNSNSCDFTITLEDPAPTALCNAGLLADQSQLDISGTFTGTFTQAGQSFTPEISGPLTKVRVYLETQVIFGEIFPSVEIKDEEGLNGTTISSIEQIPIDPDVVSTNPMQWWDITFNSPAQVTAGNTYTMVFKLNGVNAFDPALFTLVQTDNAYPGGRWITPNSSSTNEDMPFETFIGQGAPVNLELDANGLGTITVAQIDAGSFDACSNVSAALSQTSFNCDDIGVQVLRLDVTDEDNNTSSCLSYIIVNDNTTPMASCQNITVQLDQSGNASISPSDIDQDSSAGCSNPSLSLDLTDFDCSHVGDNTVTLSVANENGQTGQCAATVTIQDNVAPTAVCNYSESDQKQLEINGQVDLVRPQAGQSFTPAKSGSLTKVRLYLESFAQFGDIAPTVEILNGEGLTGNTISSIESIPIDDELETNPRQWWDIVFTSPAQLTVGNTYTILMKVNNINALDGLMRTFTQTGNPYPNGSYIDRQSNITSRDMPFETFIGQGDLVTLELDASGSLSLSTDQIIGSSDACGIANFQLSQTNLDCEDIGVNTITLSVTDNNGNSNSCDFTITLEDPAPTALCNAGLLADQSQLDINGTFAGTFTQAGQSFTPESSGPLTRVRVYLETQVIFGEIFPSVEIKDGEGLNGTTISSIEQIPIDPDVVSTNPMQWWDITFNSPAQVTAGNTYTMVFKLNGVNAFDPAFFTLVQTDNAYPGGRWITPNSSSTNEDMPFETFIGQGAPVSLELDANGLGTITVAQIDAGSFDACSNVSSSLSQTNFNCDDIGIQVLSLNVTDEDNNTSSCLSYIIVNDNTTPMASCQDITVQLDQSGNASISPFDIDQGSSAGCSMASLSLDQTDFDCSHVGDNTVTLSVANEDGQTGQCTATVTILDNVAPTAVCNYSESDQKQLEINGQVDLVRPQAGQSFTPAKSGSLTKVRLYLESFAQFGDIAPTVEILNGEGLTGTTISSIESIPIDDDIVTNPRQWWDIVFASPAQLTAGNTYTILMKVNNISALDGLMRTFTQTGNPYPNGSYIDRQSNITSRDMPFETFIGQGDVVTLELGTSGLLNLSPDQVVGSSDACGIADLQLSQTTLDCEDVGVNTITLSVTDNNGNSNSCDLTVTVEEPIPTALCNGGLLADQSQADINGTYAGTFTEAGQSFTPEISGPLTRVRVYLETQVIFGEIFPSVEIKDGDGLNGTTISSIEQIPIDPDVVSTNPMQWWDITFNSPAQVTAGDTYTMVFKLNGVNAFDPALFTLVQTDNAYPGGQWITPNSSITNQDMPFETFIGTGVPVSLVLDPTGIGTLTVDQVDAGSFDNCGIASAILSQSSFNCADIGEQIVRLTITNEFGNSTSCEASVTVEGGGAVPICKNQTVALGADGSVTISAEDLMDEASNLCGSINLSLDVSTFNCDDLGSNTVTLTATDDKGIATTCTAEVTVEDNEIPLISCPANILVANDPGTCEAIVDFTVTATDNCSANLTQDLGLSSGAAFPDGITEQQFTAIDADGNSATCSFTVEVTRTGDPDLLSAYTVIGAKEVKMKKNTVHNGGIGITKSSGEVKLEERTKLTTANTFVKAPELDLSGNSQVTNYFQGRVDRDLLPSFLASNSCGNDVKFEDNSGTATLDLECYGKIEVGKNVSINFSGHDRVKVKEMDLKEGSSISFSQSTNLLIKKELKGGKNMVIANNGHQVWIYAKKDVKFEINSSITANVYTKKKLEVEKGSDLTGLFIANEVDSKENVSWNWGQNCSSGSSAGSSLVSLTDQQSNPILETQEWTVAPELSAFPNPFQSSLNIRFVLPKAGRVSLAIFDLQGRLVRQLEDATLDAGEHTRTWDGAQSTGNLLPAGMYFVQLQLEDGVVNQKVMLQRL